MGRYPKRKMLNVLPTQRARVPVAFVAVVAHVENAGCIATTVLWYTQRFKLGKKITIHTAEMGPLITAQKSFLQWKMYRKLEDINYQNCSGRCGRWGPGAPAAQTGPVLAGPSVAALSLRGSPRPA